MKKRFDDTKFGRIASEIIDIVWLGILGVVCSLPIITIGASCCGLYYSMVKSVRHGRGRVTSEFFRGFSQNFKQSTGVWFIYLLICVPIAFIPKLIAFYIIPVGITFPWVFPFITRFSCGFPEIWKRVFFLAVKNFGRTIICAFILLCSIVIAYLLPAVIPLITGIICLILSFEIEPVFREITIKIKEDTNEDHWYNE